MRLRREKTQDEKCERARRNPEWWGDDHSWSEWRSWMWNEVSQRTCSNCGKFQRKFANPDFLNRRSLQEGK